MVDHTGSCGMPLKNVFHTICITGSICKDGIAQGLSSNVLDNCQNEVLLPYCEISSWWKLGVFDAAAMRLY